jgi:hypothetical protein
VIAADVALFHPVELSVIVIDCCLFLSAANSAPSLSGNTTGAVFLAIGCVVLQSQPDRDLQQAVAKISQD